MTGIVQYRLPIWQKRAVDKIKGRNMSMSDIGRFSLNYFLVNYSGKLDAETMDEMAFAARKKICDVRV